MLRELQVEADAPWKQRFRVPTVLWTQLAAAAPTRGLAASNQSGVYQLYAWDVPSGGLTQLTHRPEGQVFGVLSPDGRFIYYLDDKLGNEIGHLARMSFEGGELQDITPNLSPYSVAGLGSSLDAKMLLLIAAGSDGFRVYAIDNSGEIPGTPKEIYHSTALTFAPTLSGNGSMAVIMSSERAAKPQFSLLAFDTANGEKIAELWDGPETSLEIVRFSRLPGDSRLLAMTDRSGFNRPLIWDVRTGKRTDLPLGDLEGDIRAADWSADGKKIVTTQPG